MFALFETPVPPADTLDTARRILMLEGVQDPGNVVLLLRSAAAFGFDAVVLGPGCASPLSPKTLRSSMGAAGRLPTLHSDDLPAALAALRARGVTTLATALYRSRPLDEAGNDFPGGLCVVIGSEGQGLTDRTVEACDMAVRIPMTDRVESLNAAVAGSVLLWHFRVCNAFPAPPGGGENLAIGGKFRVEMKFSPSVARGDSSQRSWRVPMDKTLAWLWLAMPSARAVNMHRSC